jgi:hypothetical protein
VLRLLRHTRVPALVALLIITGSVPVSIAALVHEADDTACQPILVQHDKAAHRIGAERTAPNVPQHCAVCHWLHSLQTVVTASSVAIPASGAAHLSISLLTAAVVHTIGDVPARAPPAF